MSTTSSRLHYIDFVKGVAALSVVLLHTLPNAILKGTCAVYHIWQAVPVFLFISFYLGLEILITRMTILRDIILTTGSQSSLHKNCYP